MKILVCGGRNYQNASLVFQTLDNLRPVSCVVHGGATGADTLAKFWARDRGVPQEEYRARWDLWGAKAGPLRNAEMLRKEQPDRVIAFPGGRGTADMVRRAKAAGVEVTQVLD